MKWVLVFVAFNVVDGGGAAQIREEFTKESECVKALAQLGTAYHDAHFSLPQTAFGACITKTNG
jgi:hypothetical protein